MCTRGNFSVAWDAKQRTIAPPNVKEGHGLNKVIGFFANLTRASSVSYKQCG